MKLELSLVGTLLYLLGVVESSSSSFYDKDDYYKIPQFVYEPFSMANPMLRYYFRLDPEQSHEANERFVNRGSFDRNHIESRPGSFQEAIPYRATVTNSVEDERVPLRDAVEHIPIVGAMNILVRSGGNDGGSSDDGPFSRSSVEAFPSPVTPYRSQYDDQEVNAIVSQVSITRDNYPRIGYRGDVEALITTPNENPLLKYYRVPDTNSISAVDNIWTRYMSAEHRSLTKSNPSNSQSYPWRNPTITRESMGDAYKVVCYFESWAVYRPKPLDFDIKDIDPFACTHLIYSFAGLDEKNFTIISLDHTRDIVQGAYKATIALKERNPDLKVMIALGGWAEGGLKYSQMVATPERRKAFLDSLGTFMDQHGFDGVDLDWEYPGATDRGGVLADKENVAILCENIKEMFASKGRILTMAVPIAKIRIDDGYDVSRLSNCLDFFNLMSYDLRGPWDGVVDHHSPISQRRTDKHIHRGLNLHDGIQLFVNEGAPKNKIVVGIPLYGRSFTLETPLKSTPGSLSVSMGNEGPYTKEKGYIAYYEVCILQRNGGWQITRDEAGGPYMHKDDQWIGYDNEKYVKEKVNFAKKEKLGGVMMWAIDLDDYLGMCGKRWPLMSSIRRTLASSAVDLGAPEIQELVLSPAIAEKVEDTKPEGQSTEPEATHGNQTSVKASSSSSNVGSNIKRASNFTCLEPGYYRMDLSCDVYYVCDENFTSYEFQCPEGLVFDIRKRICTWKINVPCGKAYAPIVKMREVKCGEDGLFSDPLNCKNYVWCKSQKALVLSCNQDLYFNSREGICTSDGNKFCIPGETVHVPNDNNVLHADTSLRSDQITEEYRVVCYFSSWAWQRPPQGSFLPEHLDPSLCTHVIYAFAILDPTDLVIKTNDHFTDLDNMFYQRILSLRELGTNIKVMLGIGGWTDSAGDKYSRLVNNPEARQRFVLHTTAVLTAYGFDGLDLHWEYPVCWQMDCSSGPSTDKHGYAALVRELRQAFLQQPIPLILSAAISPARGVIARGYDVRILNANLDFFNVMTYDYHGYWEKQTGHLAPLYYREGDRHESQNSDFSIKYLISAGADPKKLVLGIPFHGQTFTLTSNSQSSLLAPATGPGTGGPITRQNGMLSYAEICLTVRQPGWKKFTDGFGSIGPYATNNDEWIGYDDPAMVMKKGEYIKETGLGGAMVWTVDFDDFHNKCCSEHFPLLRALNRALRTIPYPSPRPGGQCSSGTTTFMPTPSPYITTTDKSCEGCPVKTTFGGLVTGTTRPSTFSNSSTWGPSTFSPSTAKRPSTFFSSSTWWPSTFSPSTTKRPYKFSPSTPHRPSTFATSPSRLPPSFAPSPTLTPATGNAPPQSLGEGMPGSACTGSNYYPHPLECSKFLRCLDDVLVESKCTSGLHWNRKLNLCDWPDNAQCFIGAEVATSPPRRPSTFATSPTRRPSTFATSPTRRPSTFATSPTRTPTSVFPSEGSIPGSACTGSNYYPHPSECTKFLRCLDDVLVESKCVPGLHWNNKLNLCDWPDNAECFAGAEVGPLSRPTTFQPMTNAPVRIPDPATTSRTTWQWHTTRWTAPPRTTFAPLWTPSSDIRTSVSPPPSSTGPCSEGTTSEVFGHCEQYFHCVGGNLLMRSCPAGLHWHSTKKICDWPDSAKCSVAVRETTPEAVSIILTEQTANLPVDQSAIAVSGPAHGRPCNAGNSIFAQSSSSCSAFLICNQGSYEERHCSEGLHWNNVKHVCDWPKNVQCAGDMQVPPGQADTPVSVGRPGESSGPTAELEYVGPSSTKLSGDFKVVCYFTNFAVERPGLGKYKPEDIDETLCTHVVYAFAVLDDINLIIKTFDSAVDIDTKFYEKVTALKTKGIKVTLAIGGWVDSAGDKYSRLVNNPAARQRFVSHVVEFIKKYNFDGLDLDWEFPVCWQIKCDKGPTSDKEGFASLVRELSAAFKPKGLLLSAAVSPSKKIIDLGYDVPTLSKYFDWISVMTYDFHGAWDKKTGHGAPMYHHPDDDLDYFNTDFAIRYWIEKGADKRKIVMGMPMYGRAFTLNDVSINGLNSPAAAGKAGEYTKSAGFLSYYEICNSIMHESWTVVQDPERRMGPYAYRGNQWISFDDVDTIRRKSQYIRDIGLGGGMIWALDLDDFTNRCGQGHHPLLSTIKNVLGPAYDFSHVVPPPTQPLDHPPQPDPPQVPGIQQPPPRPQTTPQTFPKPPQVEQPQEPGDGYKVVCYFTNWAWYREGEGKYLPADVDPSLCTHINYAFAVLNQDTLLMKPHDTWADIDNNFYLKMSDLKKYGAKVLIALGGWNDSSGGKYSKLVNDPAARSRFNQHALEFIQKYNFDGLDLDWEYPKCWQVNCKLGPESDKDGFSAWIMELNALFQPYGLLLTAAVSPSFTVINAGYDVPVLSKYLDIINVMNYDYHGQWDKVTGHVAPMYEHPDDVEPKFNTDFTINYWIQLGADPKKLVLGMPMYGQSFTLTSSASNGLNAPTYGGGEAGPYTRARGFLSYYEICYFIKHQDWTVVRDPLNTMGPYAYRGQTWVSFDDIPQIEYKSNYIKQMGLGGAMIWALDLDDFRNRCGCESYPLLKTINRILRNYPTAASSCPLLGGGTVAAISENSETSVIPVLPPAQVHRPKPVLPSVKPPPSEQSHPPIAEGPEFPEENNLGEQGQAAQPQFPPGYDERPKPVIGGICASGEFVKHDDCSKFYECYKGKLQVKSCPKGSLWDGKRACRRPSDVSCQSVVHPPTRVEKPPTRVEKPPTRVERPPTRVEKPPTRVEKPPTRVERPPTRVEKPPTRVEKPPTRLDPVDHIRPDVPSRVEISSIGTKQNNEIGAAGQPCESGQFKRHQLCVKFYECVAGSFLERTCVPGLQWDGQARCNWPNKVNCVDMLNIQNNPPPLPLPFTKEPPYPASKTTVWSTTQPTTRRSTTYWPTSSMITPAGIQAHPPAPTTFEPRPTAASTWWGATEATTPAWTHPPGSLEVDGYKVVCYFTNWAWYRQGIAKYRAEDIDPNLCTHIIYGFAVLDSNTLLIKTHDSWADIDNKYYQKVANQKQHGTKVLLAIGGWNDSKGGKYSKLVNDPSARRRFIEHVVQFIKKYNFDGLDLDWEYPKCWQVDCTLGPDSDKEGFTAWIRELKAAFEPYNWLLTAAVSPSYKVMDAGYDIPALSRYLDFINVMTYDYHGHWDKMTGHVAPMFDHPDSPAPEFNANYTIHYWIEKGADRKKLIMGMPLYGQAFTLSNTKDVGLNSPGSKGQAGEYTRAAGFLAYYEICDNVKNKGYTMVRDPSGTIGPYAYKGNQWVGFDDVTMIRFKSNYIKQMGLGGGMVWALDLDDFNNRCNCEPHPLLRTIRRELRNDYPVAATMDCSLS